MELKDLTRKLLIETTNVFESIGTMDVDWNYPTVTIISKAGNTQEAGSGGMTPDSAQTEIIDPENQQPSNGGESGGSGESGGDETNKVTVGSIIQDFNTGEYGRVTSIDADGNVEWEPVSKAELESGGYLARRAGTIPSFDRSALNGLIG